MLGVKIMHEFLNEILRGNYIDISVILGVLGIVSFIVARWIDEKRLDGKLPYKPAFIISLVGCIIFIASGLAIVSIKFPPFLYCTLTCIGLFFALHFIVRGFCHLRKGEKHEDEM